MVKIVVLVPARGGSKRVICKNLRMLGGVPLFLHSVEVGKRLYGVDRVVVSTDSGEVAALGRGYEVLVRGAELCGDGVGDFEVIRHFIDNYPGYDLVVYLRPTTPFRSVMVVDEAIRVFIDAGENASSLRSVEEMGESAYKGFEMEFSSYLRPIWWPYEHNWVDMTDWPNQKCPRTYKPNGYVDIVKVENLARGTLWGDRKIGFVTPRTIEIDDEFDFWLAEQWVKRGRTFEVGREDL